MQGPRQKQLQAPTGQRPRLLFLSHRLPYPPHNGASIRTFNILRELAKGFEVVVLCFDRRDAATASLSVEARCQAIGGLRAIEVFPIPQEWSQSRLAWDHLRSVLTGEPYTTFVHDSRPFRSALSRWLQEWSPDLIHVDSLDLVAILPMLHGYPVAVTHHNVESALLRRRAAAENSRVRGMYLQLQAGRLEAAERTWLPRVAVNLAVSDDDNRQYSALAPGARVETVPNGVDTDGITPRDGPLSGCVFVGGTTWFPNRDALEWMTAEVLPRFRQLDPSSPIWWVGRATNTEKARWNGYLGMELTGYVDDIGPWMHRAACVIAPLRVGGGTRLKILDAWAYGKAVVSTAIGCEGLAGVDGENILVADTSDAFATAMARLNADPAQAHRLGAAARATAERLYSWPTIGARLRTLYMDVLE